MQLEEAVLPNFEVDQPEQEDPPPTGIARVCTLPPNMEADFLQLLWQEIMARVSASGRSVHVLIIASDARSARIQYTAAPDIHQTTCDPGKPA